MKTWRTVHDFYHGRCRRCGGTAGFFCQPTTRITAATINAELKRRGIAERIRQGRGYVYFTDGESHTWYSSSIAVCYVANLVKPTLAETIEGVLRHRSFCRMSDI